MLTRLSLCGQRLQVSHTLCTLNVFASLHKSICGAAIGQATSISYTSKIGQPLSLLSMLSSVEQVQDHSNDSVTDDTTWCSLGTTHSLCCG